MNILVATWRQHERIMRSYPAAMGVVAAAFLLVLFFGWGSHDMKHAVGYLVAVWLGMFTTDVVVKLWPRGSVGFPVKRAVWMEVGVILLCTLLGFVFLVIRDSGMWEGMSRNARYAVIPLVVFTYPIVLAGIYLFCFKYRMKELGMNLHFWYLPLLIHPILGGTVLLVGREMYWHRAMVELGGAGGLLFVGLVCSALPEEFFRVLLQTRLGMALQNKGLGFVVASFAWASLHIPSTRLGHPSMGLMRIVLGTWTIAPIGFLWGYITHRTKSLLPAVLMHGLNMWGLQSFSL